MKSIFAYILAFMLMALPPAAHADERQVKISAPACISKEWADKIIDANADGDKEAFVKLAQVGIASGKCIMLDQGERVFLEDSTFSGADAKVRRKGDVTDYWTFLGAVQ